MLSRVVVRLGSRRLLNRRGAQGASLGSVGVRECPAEPGEFACDGDRDDRAALAAFAVEAAPDAVQALLRLPGDRDDRIGLAVLAALERGPAGRRLAGEIGTLARCLAVLFQRPLCRTRRERFRSPGSPVTMPWLTRLASGGGRRRGSARRPRGSCVAAWP
jgi:hypothetical protein